jgi:hypothetical protein
MRAAQCGHSAGISQASPAYVKPQAPHADPKTMADSERVRASASRTDVAGDASARYRIELLAWVEVGESGIGYAEGRGRATLRWERIERALAAQVGEPEGVRTIVFDLVVERKHAECLVRRFDAEPGPPAQAIAQALARHLGRARCSRSLLALAAEGVPTRAYPDLETLAEDALEELDL